ncbi:MAG: hypothetical protein E6Q97_12730 [Desulfurellales bacterium]|nr:MAG: hypothetical protein E6Q97_12730 [Desulfurellales bacterium]
MSTNYYLRVTIKGVTLGDLHLGKRTASKMLFRAVRDSDGQLVLGSVRQLNELLDEIRTAEHFAIVDEYGKVHEVDEFRELIQISKRAEKPTEHLLGISQFQQWVDDDNYIWCDYEFS